MRPSSVADLLREGLARQTAENAAAHASLARTLQQIQQGFPDKHLFNSPEIVGAHQKSVRDRRQRERAEIASLSPNAGGAARNCTQLIA